MCSRKTDSAFYRDTARRVAFGDESVRVTASPPLYLLAATIVGEDCDLSELERLVPKGAKKLHWREMGKARQRVALKKVAALDVQTFIVAAGPLNPKKQERARRKCIEALLPRLEEEGIRELVMESRFPAADAKDEEHFRSLKRRAFVKEIVLSFQDPQAEHRLWIADQILGAFGDNACDAASSKAWSDEWGQIAENVFVTEIEL